MNNIEKIFAFASAVSALKEELRFKAAKNFKGDTVASHIWRLTLLLVIIAQELKLKIDVLYAVKISLVHDLPEALTGDIDARLIFENKDLKSLKSENEKKAIKKIKKLLPEKIGEEILNLWNDYSEKNSPEAKCVYALDKIESMYTRLDQDQGNYENNDLMGTYINIGYKTYPELKPVLDFIKKKTKEEFKKRNLKWKKEYDVH